MSSLDFDRKPQTTFVGQKVVSHEGAVVKVTRLELSQDARASLRSKSEGIRMASDEKKQPKADTVR
ncbi:hypothetical protein [Variovorax paradoxus]|uniref:hypothetical protein n=1 Tax=Variovorax paradoxus TaxID=34073 RepID=UPI0027D8C286|nr:hypothetical protein [Variovorax paradoxus]